MSTAWRNDPATAEQKARLAFFGCTWNGDITAGQAEDALEKCAREFPDIEIAWQKNQSLQRESPETLRADAYINGPAPVSSALDRPLPAPQKFILGMAKVAAITQETNEAAGILSAVLQDEPEKAPPLPKAPHVTGPMRQISPLIPLSPVQMLRYLEAGQSVRCIKSIAGFSSGKWYPVRQIPVIVRRTIKRPAVSGPDHDSPTTGRDMVFALPDDFGKDRFFVDRRYIGEGVTITRSAGDSPPDDPSWAMLPLRLQRLLRRCQSMLHPHFPLDTLVDHFEITPPPDLAQANPEQLHAYLRFLDAIEKLANNGFLFEASLRDDLARLAIPDCASYEDATGTAITPMGIAWALLKVGLHPQANGTLLPAEPVLIVAPSGLLVFRMLDDYKALFGAAMPPVIRLDSQETFARLISRNRGRLAPGWYMSSFQELALNKFQLLPTIPDGQMPDHLIRAYMEFFDVQSPTPAQGLELCRKIARETAEGLGTERNGIRCIYRPALADLGRDQFAAVVIDAGTRIPSEGSIIGRGLKTLAPRYRLVLTGPPVKKRLAEPPLRPGMIPEGIPPSGPILQESPARADGERFSKASPCPVCGSSECCCESSAPVRLTTSLPAPEKLALDMAKVDAITKEADELACILSADLQDEPENAPPATKTPPVVPPVTQIATVLDRYAKACFYPGRIDPETVGKHLAEYLNALRINRRIQRIERGWQLEDYPDLHRTVTGVLQDVMAARSGLIARGALGERDAREARAAARETQDLRDAGAALASVGPHDARASMYAQTERIAQNAEYAHAARRARDARGEWDVEAAAHAQGAENPETARATLHRLGQWCLFRGGWYSWDMSGLSTTYIGAIHSGNLTVQAWSKPIYDAFLAGCWKLCWTDRTLYWVAKPKVFVETGRTRRLWLHNATGPALECDAEDLYFWHGVLVPEHVVMRPDEISLQEIESDDDDEVRRVMIERYGQARYLLDSGAKEIHRDDFGALSLAAPHTFALDMARVDAVTKESEEAAEILSVVMRDEPEQITPSPKTATVPVPELPKSPAGSNSAPLSSQFTGLDAALQPVLERLLTRDSWSPGDFNALAREFHFMPLKIRDTLNDWSNEILGDDILKGEDPVDIRRELVVKEPH